MATGDQGQYDYGSLPFMGDGNAESNATASLRETLHKLHIANTKRKLKHLEQFFLNEDIVTIGVELALKKASNSP